MSRFIKYEKSIIPACDVLQIEDFRRLIKQTHDVEGIGAYKVGSILAIRYGLPALVQVVRELTDLPIIYDHQKSMTDIPGLGKDFATAVKESGANALIGFPQSGPATQEAWIKDCNELELEVIIGGEMTHPRFKRSEGGYIADDALDEIYLLGARLGVNNFIVPGNKTERVVHYRKILQPIVDSLSIYATGFVAQGGVITDTAKVAGDYWHVIVGRGIYAAKDIHTAAKEMVSQLFN
jgi:orotidine-5'-phosphate decarboxylase